MRSREAVDFEVVAGQFEHAHGRVGGHDAAIGMSAAELDRDEGGAGAEVEDVGEGWGLGARDWGKRRKQIGHEAPIDLAMVH